MFELFHLIDKLNKSRLAEDAKSAILVPLFRKFHPTNKYVLVGLSYIQGKDIGLIDVGFFNFYSVLLKIEIEFKKLFRNFKTANQGNAEKLLKLWFVNEASLQEKVSMLYNAISIGTVAFNYV